MKDSLMDPEYVNFSLLCTW